MSQERLTMKHMKIGTPTPNSRASLAQSPPAAAGRLANGDAGLVVDSLFMGFTSS